MSGPGVYEQTGDTSVTAVDGLLQAGSMVLLGGRLEGRGQLATTDGITIDNLFIAPAGGGVGTLRIQGDLYSMAQPSTLEFDVSGAGQCDQLMIDGAMNIALLLDIRLGLGYVPMAGDSFIWLAAAGAGMFSVLNVSVSAMNPDGSFSPLAGHDLTCVDDQHGYFGFGWKDGHYEHHAVFAFSGNTSTLSFADTLAPVPEPQTWGLLATGLAGVMLAIRRNRPRGQPLRLKSAKWPAPLSDFAASACRCTRWPVRCVKARVPHAQRQLHCSAWRTVPAASRRPAAAKDSLPARPRIAGPAHELTPDWRSRTALSAYQAVTHALPFDERLVFACGFE